MDIGERLKQFRELRGLSQGDIEDRTGLLRCYVSRVENGHTVPTIETLEKLARALETQLYQLFYKDDDAPPSYTIHMGKNGSRGRDQRRMRKFQHALAKMSEKDREVLLSMAFAMAKRHKEQ